MILGSGRSPGGGNGNPLGVLVWRIPWTEEPGGLQSMGSQELDTTKQLNHHYVPGTSRGVMMLLASLKVIYEKYMFSQKTRNR